MRSDLPALLDSLFETDELRGCIDSLPEAPPLARALPGPLASKEQVVHAASQLLQRHGLINGAFFDHLIRLRPLRSTDIRAVANGLKIRISESVMSAAEAGSDLGALLSDHSEARFADRLSDMIRNLPREHTLVHRAHLMIAEIRQRRHDRTSFDDALATRVFSFALEVFDLRPVPVGQPGPGSATSEGVLTLHAAIICAVQENDGERAIKRLLDFVREVELNRVLMNRATILAATVHDLSRRYRYMPMPPEARDEWLRTLGRILELADETLATAQKLIDDHVGPGPRQTTEPEKPLFQARQAFAARRQGLSSSLSESLTVRADRICKSYRPRGDRFVLRNISLALRPGEITGVVGPNGCGKTTLLRIVAGEITVDKGTLRYPLLDPGGRLDRPNWLRIRPQIGYIPQRPSRWPGRLADNLHRWAALHRVHGDANDEDVEFYLQRLDLARFRDATWSQISGGYQMRFELARVLCAAPRLLVLDEPLAPLDPTAQNLYLQDLRDLASMPSAAFPILVTSQHVHEIESIADHMLALGEEGAVKYDGPARAVRRPHEDQYFELEAPLNDQHLDDLRAAIRLCETRRLGARLLLRAPSTTSGAEILEWLCSRSLNISLFQDISSSCARLTKWGMI